jgi:cellulose synthase/poly-beta-1,6-N-acetylglucosamine synthase-like glycosyltransferase
MFRPTVKGKFLFEGEEKVYLRGVTYGAFRPDENGNEFHNLKVIDNDFALMSTNGINSVRIPHTTPPRSLLDIAAQHGLRVMVGLSAEQYVGFLIDKEGAPDIEELIRAKVRRCIGHPALLCYAIGNEIPASIVRWLGRRRVERYLERIFRIAKKEDPEGLVTYVNYPSTEYLQLSFLDLVCFNVYLETEDRLKAYLPRLQNITGDRPLIMSEVGLDSLRNGENEQAQVLDWQIRTAFTAGCAGVYIFSWTDEWYRGGVDVDDWAFGITDQHRNPKPALEATRRAFTDIPFSSDLHWPLVSVVVCTHNGARTIQNCCEGLSKLKYPNFEVIVVDDGSSDQTTTIVRKYGFRVISIDHSGLSHARNIGLQNAAGEIVAYIDDDAYPDPHWLDYIVTTFKSTKHVGVGGPNLTPPEDGLIAFCIGISPGNPTHVLLTDEIAEHIPGCNMAFRKAALDEISGFDPQFWIAGDDVDMCWRLTERGYSLGFNPAAVVWHHRRNSVLSYLRQQVHYGKAEAMLERKWPEKYNVLGHHDWKGRIYNAGLSRTFSFLRQRIYHGVWGTAPFQSIYDTSSGTSLSFSQAPEWILIIFFLIALTFLGTLWRPLLLFAVPLIISIFISILQAFLIASMASYPSHSKFLRLKSQILRSFTTFLHLLQPMARLWGRLRSGLAPWSRYRKSQLKLSRSQNTKYWSEEWQSPELRLESIEVGLRKLEAVVLRGGDYDPWDLEIQGGVFCSLRICMAIEDHGSGTQLIRFRRWPRLGFLTLPIFILLLILSLMSAVDQAWVPSIILGTLTLGLVTGAFLDYTSAANAFFHVLQRFDYHEES